jgi:Fe-S-cluster-containing dehydrogenase component
VRACASTHNNNPRFVRHGPVHADIMVANACMHCVDPVCLIGCPTGAIHRDPRDGRVIVDDTTCIGCSTCANSCPYNNIQMVEIRDHDGNFILDQETGEPIVKAAKCDLCLGQLGGPACQRACPHDALIRIDMREHERLAAWVNRS